MILRRLKVSNRYTYFIYDQLEIDTEFSVFINKKRSFTFKKKEPKFRCETYIDCLMLEMKNDFEFLSLTSNFDRT